jgi:hypothetical protein
VMISEMDPALHPKYKDKLACPHGHLVEEIGEEEVSNLTPDGDYEMGFTPKPKLLTAGEKTPGAKRYSASFTGKDGFSASTDYYRIPITHYCCECDIAYAAGSFRPFRGEIPKTALMGKFSPREIPSEL